MIAFVLFLLDFVVCVLFDRWVMFSLIAYFMYKNLCGDELGAWGYVTILLILLQDFFLYERFGLGLIWLLPFIFLTQLVKKWLFMRDIAMKSTRGRIFGTLIVMITLTFFGTRGNRFLSVFQSKRGKSGLQTGGAPYKKGLF